MTTRLILDVDTGTDDAIAIMLAALSPGLELVGCTTVFGNTGLTDCTENTLRVLETLGRPDIPVHEGAAGPLRGAAVRPADHRSGAIHGRFLPLPEARTRKADAVAIDFLAATYAEPSDVVLVAVAPLTNVAALIERDPTVAARIPRLVVMGGGHALGNSTPSAEHNIWADAEAARIVFAAGIRQVELVTLDATHMALFSDADGQALEAIGTPPARAAAAMIRKRIEGYDLTQPMAVAGTAPVHDALCIALLSDPTLVTPRHVHVDVETDGRLTRGRTVIDLYRRGDAAANCDAILECDGPRFVRHLIETFRAAAKN